MNPPDKFALSGNPSTIARAILGPLSIEQQVLAVAMALIAAGHEQEVRTAVFQISGAPRG